MRRGNGSSMRWGGADSILDPRLPQDDPFGIEFDEMPEVPTLGPVALQSG